MSNKLADAWQAGESYEQFMASWSRPVAVQFLQWLAIGPGKRWLDVGCGTGALSGQILELASLSTIMGVDPAESFIAYAQQNNPDERLKFQTGDALSLPVDGGAYDVAVSGLALNFIADPAGAVREMIRAVDRGGIVAVYVWDYAGEMQLLRTFWDAAVALDPAAEELDEGIRFPLCRPDRLQKLFSGSGLQAVSGRAINVQVGFQRFEDYWLPFLGGTGPAPAYVAKLPSDGRIKLKQNLRERLPLESNVSMVLRARAWAVNGQV